MLIALHLFFLNVVLPQIAAYARVFFGSAIVICITLFGISMIFRAVGLNWFEKILLMGIGGIFKAIRYICSGIIRVIGWIFSTIFRMVPYVFYRSREMFNRIGINHLGSNLLAIIVTAIFLLIII